MGVSYNGGTQQPWVFLLKMIILGFFLVTWFFLLKSPSPVTSSDPLVFGIPHQLRAIWISWATSLAIRNGLISLARRMDGATIIAAVVRGSGGWSAGDFAAELVTDIGHLLGWDLAEDELLRYKFFQAFDELMQVGDVGVVLNLNFDVLFQVFVFFFTILHMLSWCFLETFGRSVIQSCWESGKMRPVRIASNLWVLNINMLARRMRTTRCPVETGAFIVNGFSTGWWIWENPAFFG